MPELLRGIGAEITPGEGDNLIYIDDAARRMETLGSLMPGSISLIYMDPPFRTGKQFDMKFKAEQAERSAASMDAFSDMLSRQEYLSLLGSVLESAKRLLTDDGLLFIHLDWREQARVRLLADEIFGEGNFINEIIWAYESGGRSKNFFSRKHDTILLYAAGKEYDLHIEDVAEKLAGERDNHMARGVDEDGRTYRSIVSGGKTYRYYDDEPVPPSDVWTDISHLQQRDPQRTGYATQKPLKLLERIVKSASRPGDTVLDPFFGSGTTLEAAYKNDRRFIGIDANPLCAELARKRIGGCRIYCPESAGSPEIAVERAAGITFESVYLTAFRSDDERLKDRDGLAAVDSWALGRVENGVFTALCEETRSRTSPRLKGELRAPMYVSDMALRVSDIFGGRYFYRL